MRAAIVPASARFDNCGQGLRVGGDVKLRGVLVGTIGAIERVSGNRCEVTLDLFPEDIDQIPQNVGAQIRAKTIFGEKWVELLMPPDPVDARISEGYEIPEERTVDPLEVETILNVALPLLEAIDPEHLAGALEALASGFIGHEDAAIRGIEAGIEALEVPNRNEALLKKGLRQLAGSGQVLKRVDDDLLAAFENLDKLNRFTVAEQELIEASLRKTPELLRELSLLFETRYSDFVKLANSGATVVTVLAARANDLDRLLNALPRFNANWIRNLNHVCRYRQATDEAGRSRGSRVPGRCWRVHNLTSHSRGPDRAGARADNASTTTPRSLRGLLEAPLEGAR